MGGFTLSSETKSNMGNFTKTELLYLFGLVDAVNSKDTLGIRVRRKIKGMLS